MFPPIGRITNGPEILEANWLVAITFSTALHCWESGRYPAVKEDANTDVPDVDACVMFPTTSISLSELRRYCAVTDPPPVFDQLFCSDKGCQESQMPNCGMIGRRSVMLAFRTETCPVVDRKSTR